VKPTVVRLRQEVRDRIAALVGKSGMAAFIRDAVEVELRRREKASAKSSKNAAPPSAEDPPR